MREFTSIKSVNRNKSSKGERKINISRILNLMIKSYTNLNASTALKGAYALVNAWLCRSDAILHSLKVPYSALASAKEQKCSPVDDLC